jgi:hypothetical protein
MTIKDSQRYHVAILHIGDQNHDVWRNFKSYALLNRMNWDDMQEYIAEHYSAVVEVYEPAHFIGTDRWRVVFNDYMKFVKFVSHWSDRNTQ